MTGARGFIGRHLAVVVGQTGAAVAGLGHGAWSAGDALRWSVRHWLNGEISQSNLDLLATETGVPDTIFHLAGGSSVGFSIQAPEEDFYRSAVSAIRLLEWARHHAPSCRLVLASSAAVYGSAHTRPIREDDPISPYSPYGFHKRSAELLFESYFHNFSLSTSIVRLFSIYGPGLRKQLLWDLCNRLHGGLSGSLELGGYGDELRDFLHVRDAASFLHLVGQSPALAGGVLNVGSGVGLTVRQVAQDLCQAYGENAEIRFSGQVRPGDPRYLVADTSASSALDWMPKNTWAHGLNEYVDWYRKNRGSEF